ncbi:MAG TPA: sulfite exporter TauE/SafE family protein [Chitinophagaceae bacterium]|nr:sulfite exporter TauE/SafE family protein [Chitinophagaceae bacterium]
MLLLPPHWYWDIMDILGYVAAIFIGIVLGLIGSGGSILTIPVLVYLFQIDVVLATSYALFIVGITSVVGAYSYFKKELVDFKLVLFFGMPSIAAVFLSRRFILPAIPQHILQIEDFFIVKNNFILLIFAVLMLFSALSMVRRNNIDLQKTGAATNSGYLLFVLEGLAIGTITGVLGAGGGFLIIPVLVHVLKLPMKKAVGTALVIVSINTLFGFLFSLPIKNLDLSLMLSISGIAIVGILIGSRLSNRIEGEKLKPIFGWFVLIMGIYILVKEIFLK